MHASEYQLAKYPTSRGFGQPAPIDNSRKIHTVINSTTPAWQPKSTELAKFPIFTGKSCPANRKARSERILLCQLMLFRGGNLPPKTEHPLVYYPLAAWNLEQHGDRGTVVEVSRDANAGRKGYFSSSSDGQRKL